MKKISAGELALRWLAAMGWLAFSLVTARAEVGSALDGVRYASPGGSTEGSCDTWAAACDLQSALTAAAVGEEVWVEQGVYKPTTGSDRTIFFALESGVGIYGGFTGVETAREQRDWAANVTVLSGDIDGNDFIDANGVTGTASDIVGTNCLQVVVSQDADYTAVLDGFTITAGSAIITETNSGGGMYNVYSDPTLTNLIFSGNQAMIIGGGMYNIQSSPTLENVSFIGNQAGQGGGLGNEFSDPSLTGITFLRNHASVGGGMQNRFSSPTMTNLIFSDNEADSGGGLQNEFSNPSLEGGLFVGNMALGGGGIANYESSLVLTNVTIHYNKAPDMDGGFSNGPGSHLTLQNSILWGNGGDVEIGEGSLTLTYSLVEGGCPAGAVCDHVLDADPRFKASTSGDLRLMFDSPALDAGNNLLVTAFTDLEGKPRLLDVLTAPNTGLGTPPLVDLGAYEAYYAQVFLPLVIRP